MASSNLPVLHDVEDRREGLLAHHLGLLRHLGDRGLHVEAVGQLVEADALAAEDLAALGRGALQRSLHTLEAGAVDQRADERAGLAGIADLDAAIGALQARQQAIIDLLMHDQAAQRGAALAGGADGREGDGAHGQVEIGRGRHDHGVVAAELQQRAAEALGHARRDLAAHARGAGGADEGDAGIVDQRLADRAAADDDLQQVLGCSAEAAHGLAPELLAGERRQRRLLRRLPHDRVAADDGEGEVPRPHGDREVEGADDADHAERMPGLHHAVARPLRGDGEAVELAREADGEVADVDHLLHLALALLQDLAGLDGDELAERRLGRAQLLAEQADQLAAPRRRHLAPGLERAVRLGDGGARPARACGS